MFHILVPAVLFAALLSQAASADEIRRTTFAPTLHGTWAPSMAFCTGDDKSRVVIDQGKYRNVDGDCRVLWIVETAGAAGINYGVHSTCVGADKQSKPANLIIRSHGDAVSIGTGFDDLKPYQRCPAN